MDKLSRIGKIIIPSDVITHTNFQLVDVFHELDFKTLYTERSFARDVHMFIGISSKFDEIDRSIDSIPEYCLAINDDIVEINRVDWS